MTDRKKLEAERKEIIEKILRIQKEFMELERQKGVTEKDLHVNPFRCFERIQRRA